MIAGISFSALAAEGTFGLGGGIYYNKMLGTLNKDNWDIDDDYFSYLLSLKYQYGEWFGIEGLLDYYPGRKDIDYSFKPMATAVLGNFINAGVGINSTYLKYKDASGAGRDRWTDLSYHYKIGMQIPIAEIFWLNIDAYYFADQLRDMENFDKDYISFGARLHYLF
jgi:hypothetical protein